MYSRTSSGTKNAGSSGQPSFAFAARTPSSPSGSPWTLAVFSAGLPNPMIVRQ